MTRPDAGGQPPGSPAAVELEAVQAATRWLVGAAAAVLAVLLAGVQLSALGQLAVDRPGRLIVAVIAYTAGLGAVGLILVLAARVLVSPGWTLSKHRRLHVAWFQLQERGATTLPDDLDTEHPSSEREYSVTNNDDVERLGRRREEATGISAGIAIAANLAETRRRYRRLVRALSSIGVLPVIAVPVYAWATTVEPEPAITTPTAIRIQFVPDRSVIQQAGLPDGCAGREARAPVTIRLV